MLIVMDTAYGGRFSHASKFFLEEAWDQPTVSESLKIQNTAFFWYQVIMYLYPIVLMHRICIFFFYIPIKIYNTDLLVTLLTEYLTTLQGRCHWVQNTMTTPWHHKKLRRFTYELQKKKKLKT